jgi:phosphate transport system ATP-binding protein
MRIEDVLKQLQQHITIVLVTNLVQQARRLAHNTAFFLQGELVEIGPTHEVFGRNPKDRRTFQYTQGQFG